MTCFAKRTNCCNAASPQKPNTLQPISDGAARRAEVRRELQPIRRWQCGGFAGKEKSFWNPFDR
jgi:hypothetical protein